MKYQIMPKKDLNVSIIFYTGNVKIMLDLESQASGFLNETRYNNLCELDKYEEIIHSGKKPIEWEEKLSIKDEIEESIFLGLRMNRRYKI